MKSTYSRCRQYFVDRDRKAQRELQSGQIYYSKVMKEIQKNQEKVCSYIVIYYIFYFIKNELYFIVYQMNK